MHRSRCFSFPPLLLALLCPLITRGEVLTVGSYRERPQGTGSIERPDSDRLLNLTCSVFMSPVHCWTIDEPGRLDFNAPFQWISD